MSKLSFRARALDASKPMPIYMAEELPDLPDYSAINRAVPQMPSGMQKEEECEHHLQRAICAGLIIPTPEVSDIPYKELYDKIYPANYKQPRQLIHMQPFTMEQDIPDYDMDSDDERWLQSQTQKLDLNPLKFEEMMDRLEKSSGQTVVTLNEAKALLKEDDDLIIAVFDYWLNKRLKTQHPLILTVKTEHRIGTAANNPYLAFRRRTEKMQTRKNRKNDEASYEKMLKLRRDLYRAVTLLELVKRREKIKREHVHLTVEVYEKRYQAKDFNGAILAEAALKSSRPAFTPIFQNHYTNQGGWMTKGTTAGGGTTTNSVKDSDSVLAGRLGKRQYKKRKHKILGQHGRAAGMSKSSMDYQGALSSDEEAATQPSPEAEEAEDEGRYAFRRNKSCSYHMPVAHEGNWPWCSKEDRGSADPRYRYTLTSLSAPRRCIGFARRRVGRGGRVILDRASTNYDDLWRTLDFSISEPNNPTSDTKPNTSNLTNINNATNSPFSLRTADFSDRVVKSETISDLSLPARTSSISECELRVEVKQELMEEDEIGGGGRKLEEDMGGERVGVKQEEGVGLSLQEQEDKDEMVEFLRSVRRSWLHFRPKTPDEEDELACSMLPEEEDYFTPSFGDPFSMEIQPLEAPSSLLDASTFLTDPFTFDMDVPICDTRQKSPLYSSDTYLNLNDSLVPAPAELFDSRTIGCSRFTLRDADGDSADECGTIVSRVSNHCSETFSDSGLTSSVSTFPSPKVNNSVSVNKFGEMRVNRGNSSATSTDQQLCTTNGMLPVATQLGLEVTANKTINNKLSYAYTSGGAPVEFQSLHNAARTLTLNSHSANILEIPLNNESDSKLSKTEPSNNGNTAANNKAKPIVRKNNLIMEVT